MQKYEPCEHRRSLVRVGPYTITASGTQFFKPHDLLAYDLIIPLESKFLLPPLFGVEINILMASIPDFSPPPDNWRWFLEEKVIPQLEEGKSIITFCIGSHGRTGTMLASLIALLESEEEAPDPIQAARERHCSHAVETREQAKAIFALRGSLPPCKYSILM